MADVDVNRADQFDRSDFAARPLRQLQGRVTQQPAQSLPAATLAPSETAAATPPSPAAAPAGGPSTSDAEITAAHLSGLGWSQAKIQKILGGPDPEDPPADAAKPEDPIAQAGTYLRSLGWTESDIARLLVGPEKSHLTAEALFRQHAANSAADQQALLKALAQAGAQKIKPDPALLSGLDVAHLSPESPSDLEQLISQFAELPDVQKQRFLLLLNSQKPSRKDTRTQPDRTRKTGGTEGGSAKSPGSAGEVLPVVKSSLDLLSTALKGLLGTTKDASKKSPNAPGKRSAGKDSIEDDFETDDPSSPTEDESADEDAGPMDEAGDNNDDTSSPSLPEDPLGTGSDREPD
jgi:hypothetical protein